MGRPVARPPLARSGVRPSVLPCLVPRQVIEEVLAEVLELRPDCLEVEEEHPHVVGGALLAVLARLLCARALRGLGLGGDQEGEEAGEFCVACMAGSIVSSDFYGPRGPHVVEVDGTVAVMFSST